MRSSTRSYQRYYYRIPYHCKHHMAHFITLQSRWSTSQRCCSKRLPIAAIPDTPYLRRLNLCQLPQKSVVPSIPNSRASTNLTSAAAYLPPSWHLTIWFVIKRERSKLKCLLLNRVQENFLYTAQFKGICFVVNSEKTKKNWVAKKSSGQHKRTKRFRFLWF